jgi:hypothetical protein
VPSCLNIAGMRWCLTICSFWTMTNSGTPTTLTLTLNPTMLKRIALFAAAITLSVAALAQSWQSDLDLANIKLAAADRHLQAALDAKTNAAAIASLRQATDAYGLAKTLYDQVAKQIEEESARYRWSPRQFTSYGDAQRGHRRADDGVSAATAEMMGRITSRNGQQAQR